MNLIISIEKKWFDLMVEGKKKYEFRRKFIDTPCNAFIYVPSPICEIQGYVEFGDPIIDTPNKINRLALSQGINEDSDILEYMEGIDYGYAIPIKKVKKLNKPISLDYLRENYTFTAPQSYIIVDKKPFLLDYLLNSLGQEKRTFPLILEDL